MTLIQSILRACTVRPWLRPRPRRAHKGDFGHVLIVAGSKGMMGAALLSAQGALRGGAGLVTAALPEGCWRAAARRMRPEAMTLPLPETRAGTLSSQALPKILDFIERRRVSALAVGPGLSRHPETARLVREIVRRVPPRRVRGIVQDADGFLALSEGTWESRALRRAQVPMIVTPHEGELARFCGIQLRAVRVAREKAALRLARANGIICVLKGRRTVVTDGKKVYLNSTGNPGMATGGSGDVLSGLIAALLGQVDPDSKSGPPALRAAALGVFAHGLAGDIAARVKTEMGLVAGDVAEALPQAFKKILN